MVTTITGVDPDAPTFQERIIVPIKVTAKRYSPIAFLAVAGATVALAPPPFNCLGVAAVVLSARK